MFETYDTFMSYIIKDFWVGYPVQTRRKRFHMYSVRFSTVFLYLGTPSDFSFGFSGSFVRISRVVSYKNKLIVWFVEHSWIFCLVSIFLFSLFFFSFLFLHVKYTQQKTPSVGIVFYYVTRHYKNFLI